MIVTEIQGNLVHTYSDAGVMIHGGNPEADYTDAWDPVDAGRIYTETDIPVPGADEPAETEDYEAALNQLGVSV